ncbi:saccharopine dehydrogenase NADP-binding domain-containing protein [Streptomyces canus]|uniref:saccharopine dehydrogenase family protein n=1 Tax=Streptomyces canus TaxID=58343 RepID=UPI00386C5189|nr:saccharopine dehydrogenase NADP-binding domain-containing protein [Streptomyces canus]
MGKGQGKAERAYDIVLYGATGFVGKLTAEYLAKYAPEGLRWAIAGRNAEKLAALREQLPGGAEVGVLQADGSDARAVRELARQARVVATTVGPYVINGEELVAACADEGTDYLDLTGESEFVDQTFVRHDARARETGARIVHAAGFDSIPHDLGTYFTVQQLPKDVPITVDGFVRAEGMFSGGTFNSTLIGLSRTRQATAAAQVRKLHEPHVEGRRVYAPVSAPRFAGEVGAWALPLPTLDAQVVQRSAAALLSYGPDFRYRHYAAVKTLPFVVGGVALVAALVAAAQVPPLRRWLGALLKPGEGPSAEKRAKSWFSVRFVGEGGGRRVFTEVAGGDPGYGETAKMLAESALCLAFDDLPVTAGQVTTAVAMGDALIERLRAAGITFRVAASR